jgi:hypothetical protein
MKADIVFNDSKGYRADGRRGRSDGASSTSKDSELRATSKYFHEAGGFD